MVGDTRENVAFRSVLSGRKGIRLSCLAKERDIVELKIFGGL